MRRNDAPGKDKTWWKRNGITLLLLLVALAGAALLVYPAFSNWWNSFHQTRAMMSYAEAAANLDAGRYEAILNEATAYNAALAESGVRWSMTEGETADYEAVLSVTGTGIMACIDIPKAGITLPVYHGTEESVLQVAVGHIAGTSLPVGGESTHCVLSGHRGLPSARLFTDIDKLVEGDTFTITVLDRTLTYEVDQIRIVKPFELDDLRIEKGQDLCTLVTCTPYGVNTHRLLVRGHRIANAQGEANVLADALQIEPVYIAPFIAMVLLLFLLVFSLVTSGAARRRRREAEALRKRIHS